jgi:hypothetical protein
MIVHCATLLQIQNHSADQFPILHFLKDLHPLVSNPALYPAPHPSLAITDLGQLIHLLRSEMSFHDPTGSEIQTLCVNPSVSIAFQCMSFEEYGALGLRD